MNPENAYRLPRTLLPRRYDLRLTPDLDALEFTGVETIALDVVDEVTEIVLNAVEIEITNAVVETTAGSEPAGVAYDEETQRVILTTGSTIPPGDTRLTFEFRGVLNDRLHGFYRSTFTDIDTNTRTVAVTQFEATDARRAFPCFDEPDFKAVFAVTLVVPPDQLALSNTSEVSRRAREDGLVEVAFAETIPMSTYLVAFVVGPLEATAPVDVDGIPLRVVAPRGKGHLTDFALRAGEACLRYLSSYYGIPYPGDKVDLVAIPDFAFGAMENLGCVTFRESALLVDTATATQAELVRILDVVGHELAHMWFGDLVTMKWWNGIWLNEAFASFMEMKSTDAVRPEWKRWLAFAAGERPWANGIDALSSTRPVEFEVRSPDEANEMFDALTYGKGSSVLRMIEQFLGEDVFRAGVGAYLRAHAFSNTTTGDLWAALDAASGLEVGEIMDTWILQGGFPQVSVAVVDGRLELAQTRFLLAPRADLTRWKVPVQLRGEADGRPFHRSLILETPTTTVDLDGEVDWIVANAGGHGFYRVAYTPELRRRLVDHLPALDDLERYCLVNDTWGFVESGQSAAVEVVELAAAFRHEQEQAVWQAVLGALDALDHHVVSEEARPTFSAIAADLIAPAYERLGWEPAPGEGDLTRRLRGTILGAGGRLARLPHIVDRARLVSAAWLDRRESPDPEVTQASLFITAALGDMADYESFRSAHRAASTPQDELRLLQALTAFDLPEAVDATTRGVLDGTVRSQDAAWVLARLLAGRRSGVHAWNLIAERWDDVSATLPPATLRRFVEGIPALSDPVTASAVRAFFAAREMPGVTKTLEQHLEILAVNVALRQRETERFNAWLTAR